MLSLVLDVEGADSGAVRRSVASVTGQRVGDWELLLHGADADVVAEKAADPRVRVVSVPGPARQRVEAAVREAGGEMVAFLGTGDALAGPEVLGLVSDLLDEEPDVDFCYGDEVVVDADGEALEEVARPAWSPERLLGESWVDGLSVLRTSVARRAWKEGLLDPWERDLPLRVTASSRVARLPAVLFHRLRRSSDADSRADRSAGEVTVVREHLRRMGVAADVVAGPVEGTCRVSRTVPDDLSVTVVVPTCGRRGLARGERRWFVLEAVRSLLQRSGRPRVEVVVVHAAGTDLALLEILLALGDSVRLVPFLGPFSPPAMVGLGVAASASDVVVLADERLEVGSDRFLAELLGPLTDDGVGMTGPRVLDQRGTLIDAGLAFQRRQVTPVLAGRLPDDPGPGGLLAVSRESSGLGSACLALRRPTFELAGGLTPRLAHGYHVDLAFKLRHLGLRRVWVPTATAYLLGLRSPPPPLPTTETLSLRDRWRAPDVDEYVGPEAASGVGQD